MTLLCAVVGSVVVSVMDSTGLVHEKLDEVIYQTNKNSINITHSLSNCHDHMTGQHLCRKSTGSNCLAG